MKTIKKRFIYYKKYNNFKRDLDSKIIANDSIVFIEDSNIIWTQGHEYKCGSVYEDSSALKDLQDAIKNLKNGLKQIAFTADYDDLINTPNIPTVEDILNSDVFAQIMLQKQDKLIPGYGIKIEDGIISTTLDFTVFEIVDDINNVIEPNPNKIYIEAKKDSNEKYKLLHYIYIDGEWAIIGEMNEEINLTLYYTKDEINNLFYNKEEIHSNFYTKEYIDYTFYNKLYIDSNFYNKEEINNLFYKKGDIDLSVYKTIEDADAEHKEIWDYLNSIDHSLYTKQEDLDALKEDILNEIPDDYVTKEEAETAHNKIWDYLNSLGEGDTDVPTPGPGNEPRDYYTKEEVDELIKDLVSYKYALENFVYWKQVYETGYGVESPDPEEYDLYIGSGNSWNDVINDNNKVKSNEDIYNEYLITVKNYGDLMFVVLPNMFSGKIESITMSDFKIPMNVIVTEKYVVYKSLNQYKAGIYPIKIVR